MQPDTSKRPANAWLRPTALVIAVIAVVVTAVVSLTFANHRSAPADQQTANDGPTSTSSQPPAPATPSASSAVNTEPSQSSTISIGGQGFSPATLTVATSTPVTWKNDTSEDRAIDMADNTKPGPHSPQLKPGASFTYAFTVAGTYEYVDVTRPDISGTVIVKDPGQ